MQDIVPGVTRRGPAPRVPTRLLALVVIAAAVAWAIVQGTHRTTPSTRSPPISGRPRSRA